MKIYDTLTASASKFADRTAVVHLANRVNYEELYRKSRQIADYISDLNIECGSRVGIVYENSIEYIFLYYGIKDFGCFLR